MKQHDKFKKFYHFYFQKTCRYKVTLPFNHVTFLKITRQIEKVISQCSQDLLSSNSAGCWLWGGNPTSPSHNTLWSHGHVRLSHKCFNSTFQDPWPPIFYRVVACCIGVPLIKPQNSLVARAREITLEIINLISSLRFSPFLWASIIVVYWIHFLIWSMKSTINYLLVFFMFYLIKCIYSKNY